MYNDRNLNDFDKIYYSDKASNYIGIDIHEGGYSNNPEDNGGRTNFGITQSSLDEYNNADTNTGWGKLYKDKQPMPRRVEDIDDENAKKIYKQMYYQRYGIDRIADLGLVRHVFDQAINPGPGGTIKYLQQWINDNTENNLIVDGVIGSQSQKIINSLSKAQINKLHADLVKRRVQYYFNEANKDIDEKIKNKEKVENVVYALNGYINRTYDFAIDRSNYLKDLEEARRLQKIYSEIK